jgi:thymidylate kinase
MLIVIEGVSTSGKSTLAQSLTLELMTCGLEVYDLATTIQQTNNLEIELKRVIQGTNVTIDPIEELLLYSARLAYKARVALALDRGSENIVIADRYHKSLFVLSHYVRGLGRQLVNDAIRTATRDYGPSVSIFLDVDYPEYIKRGGEARGTRSAAEGQGNFDRQRQGFRLEYEAETGQKLWFDSGSQSLASCIRQSAALIRSIAGKR